MSEHGSPFGLLVGLVGSKLEGGEVCKQTGYGGPTMCCRALDKQKIPSGLGTALMEHPAGPQAAAGHRGSGHHVLAQAALVPWQLEHLGGGSPCLGTSLSKGAWQGF